MGGSVYADMNGKWSQVTYGDQEDISKPVMSTASALVKDTEADEDVLVLFGGCTSSCCFAPIADTYLYHIQSNKWMKLMLSEAPSARFGSVSTSFKENMLMFGGTDLNQGFLNELWMFELGSKTWNQLVLETHDDGMIPARNGAGGFILGEKYLLVYGGINNVSGVLNDMYLIELNDIEKAKKIMTSTGVKSREEGALKWSKLKAVEASLPFLAQMVIVPSFVGDQSALITTGTNEMGEDTNSSYLITINVDENTVTCKSLNLSEEENKVMVRHGASALYPALTQVVDNAGIFGGVNTTMNTLPSSFLRDEYTVNSTSLVWENDSNSVPPNLTARAYSSITHGDGYTLLFGGFSGYTGGTDDYLLNDMWIYNYSNTDTKI